MNKMMSEAEFCELAGQYDYVPVHVLLPGDRETPISLYEKLVGDLSGAYSRRINIQHRLVYEVLPEQAAVKVLRMWSHYE